MLQRSARLGLPALLAVTISLGLYLATFDGTWTGEAEWLANGLWQSPPTFGTFIEQVLLYSGREFPLDNVLWSLEHEWRLCLVLPLIAAAPAFQGRKGAVLLVLIGIGVTALLGGRWSDTNFLRPGLLGALRTTLYFTLPFALGAALEQARIEHLQADRWQTAAGLAAVVGLARVGTDLAIFAASAILIWLAQQPGMLRSVLRHSILVWLGTMSFSLYLIHEPVLVALHHALHHQLSPVVICTISLAAAMPAAWLFYICAERPVHRFARRIGRAFQTPVTAPAV